MLKNARKKMQVNKPKSNTPESSKNERNERDPDYAPKSCHNYVKLTSNELNSIANIVRIYHETDSVDYMSDEEDVLPCRNKYKSKPKNKNLSQQREPQVCGTKFGQGSGGFPFSSVSMCKHTNETNAATTARPLMLDQPISVEDSLYPLSFDNIPALNLQSQRAMPSTSTIRNDVFEDCSFRTSILPEEPHVFTSTRIGSISDDCSSDITHLNRSNITIRTPQSKRVKEARHISIPNGSKPKAPINQNGESDIMNFVEHLVATEEMSINQKVHELCERIHKTAESCSRNVLQDALDQLLITSDNSTDRYDQILDNSVEVIDPVPEMPNNIHIGGDDSVQVIESDEIISIASDIDDVDTPSTSRITRATTRKRAAQNSTVGPPTKRNKNENATKIPSISETAPSATCVNQDSLVTTKNESPAGLGNCPICLESLENRDISSTNCGHIFCTPCIIAAIKVQKSCPYCCKHLSLKKIHPLFIV